MNRPDEEFAARVARHLDAGAERVAPAVRERLEAARRTALAHKRAEPAHAFGLAWAWNAITHGGGSHGQGARYALAASALVLALLGYAYWQTMVPGNDFSDIDVSLLTDDLPINAYLDNGFDSWLKRVSR